MMSASDPARDDRGRGLFVVTGPPGSGKTTLLLRLAELGFTCVAEPAREVIAEQRAAGGRGLYDRDPVLFNELMLERAAADHVSMSSVAGPVLFDRAIPDLIGYAELFGLDTAPVVRVAAAHRYEPVVFSLPSWPEIYTTDSDRKMTFEQADAFGTRVAEIYRELGYTLIDVPRDDVGARASLIARTVGEPGGEAADRRRMREV